MKLNELTKSFFNSSKQLYCRECNNNESKTLLKKRIEITAISSFDEYSGTIINWEYSVDNKQFLLSKNIEDNPVFIQQYDISNLHELTEACKYINNLSFQINRIKLYHSCNDCGFHHTFSLKWSLQSKLLTLVKEWIVVPPYCLSKSYHNNSSCISVNAGAKMQKYNFDYLVNLNTKNYRDIKRKIQQTLLLGQ